MCYGWLILRSNNSIAQGHGVFARSQDANSNIAEFLALIEGLDALQDFAITGEPVRVCGDAKTIIDQMRGVSQVHAASIKPLYRRARKLARRFSHIEWKWLPRQNNHLADNLTRKALRQIRHDQLNYNVAVQAVTTQTSHIAQSGKLMQVMDLRVYNSVQPTS